MSVTRLELDWPPVSRGQQAFSSAYLGAAAIFRLISGAISFLVAVG